MTFLRHLLLSRKGLGIVLALAATLASAVAFAYFTTTTATGSNGQGRSGSLSAATIGSATGGAGTVALSWSAVTPPASGTVQYYVSRGAGMPAGDCPTSSAPSTATSCTDSGLSAGTYSYTVTAVWHSWTATSAAKSVVLGSGPASTIAVASGATQSATVNTAFARPLVAVVKDSAGNPAAGVAVTFSAPTTGASGTFAATGCSSNSPTTTCAATTDASGNATSSTFTASTMAGSYNVSAAAAGVAGTATFAETNVAAGASTLAFVQQPSNTTAGAAISPAVTAQVLDLYGNSVADNGASVSMAVATGPGGFSGGSTTTAATNSSGLVTFSNLSLNTAGTNYTLRASSTGLTPATSNSFSVTAATTADVMSIVQGNGQSAAVGGSLATALGVKVADQFGNAVPNVAVTFSAPSSGASGSFATCAGGNPHPYQCVVSTDASGNATASAFTTNTTAGGYSVTTSASGVASPSTFSETNNPGAASQVTITPSPSSAAASSTTNVQLSLQLKDTYGNNTTSSGTTTLALTSSSGNGYFASSNGVTGSSMLNATFATGVGTATAYYGDTKAGTPTINAKNGSTTWGTTAVTITAKTTGDSMSIVQGNSQSASVSSAFSTALEVNITDQFGNPVPNMAVTFSAPSSGASGGFATCGGGNPQTYQCVISTNASGNAVASTLTANGTGGGYSVTTSAPGVASPSSFVVANTTSGPTMTLSPTSGHAGTVVRPSGSGWTHSSTLTATFNGATVTLSNGTTDSNGHITSTCAFTVPSLLPGNYLVVVKDGAGLTQAATFTIN